MKYISLILTIIFLCACNDTSNNNQSTKQDLKNYYKTSNIEINLENPTAEIVVYDSPLIKREREKKGTKWETLEAFCSLGALIFSQPASKQNRISNDSIKVRMYNDKSSFQEYSYKINDLEKVWNYIDTCTKFSKFVGNQEYDKARNLLAKEAFSNKSTQEIDTTLYKMFGGKKVYDISIIACNFYEGVAGLYINVKYEHDEIITYLFSFKLDGDGKIFGVSFL